MHPDMSKQYIARHDKAMRTVIQAFTKGQCGNHYLIADVGKTEGLKDIPIGVHSKRVSAFLLLDRCLQARGFGPCDGEGFLAGVSRSHTEQDETRNPKPSGISQTTFCTKA